MMAVGAQQAKWLLNLARGGLIDPTALRDRVTAEARLAEERQWQITWRDAFRRRNSLRDLLLHGQGADWHDRRQPNRSHDR